MKPLQQLWELEEQISFLEFHIDYLESKKDPKPNRQLKNFRAVLDTLRAVHPVYAARAQPESGVRLSKEFPPSGMTMKD